MTKRLICIILVLLAGSAWATNWYVQPTGDDSNDGKTVGNAFKTMEPACDSADAGDDTVFVYDGYWESGSPVVGEYDSEVHDSQYIYRDTAWGSTCGHYNLHPCNAFTIQHSGSSGSHVVFKGTGGRPHIQGDKGEGGKWSIYGIHARNKSYVTIDHFEISRSRRGLSLLGECNNITVNDCISHDNAYLRDNNGGGIVLSLGGSDRTTGVIISNCTIYHNGEYDSLGVDTVPDTTTWYQGINTGGIYAYNSDSCSFYNNTIYNEYNGVRLKGDCTYDTVRNNVIYDCNVSNAGYGINIGTASKHLTLAYNSISNSGYGGIYLMKPNDGEPCSSMVIYNNTVFGSRTRDGMKEATDETRYIVGTNFFNNIIMEASNSYHCFNLQWDHSDEGVMDYNCYYDPNRGNTDVVNWGGSSYTLSEHVANNNLDSNSVNVDPKIDTTDYSLPLTSESPAAVKTGGRGGSWPSYMGAHEYNAGNSGKRVIILK